ncbi:hypothetical protein SUDANB176_04271 [Streptomyces sp. enrichment culture]|uniref:hypothetical protein n=1 Tax=Streptomyces sp. enrichment culture TaxID=1795815 RepID=UPI003F566932
MIPAFLVLILPLLLFDRFWGPDVWSGLAPEWPGGPYAFAAVVGALGPLALAAWVAPLTRMAWKKSKPRTLARAAASLPGLVACYLVTGAILATWRPKRRSNRDGDCYREGGACWVHEQYPYLWVAGLAAMVATGALLLTLLFQYVIKDPPAGPEESAEPAGAPGPAAT